MSDVRAMLAKAIRARLEDAWPGRDAVFIEQVAEQSAAAAAAALRLRTEYAWCLGDPNEGVPVTGPEHVVRRLASMPSDKAGGSPGDVYVREVTDWRAES